MDLVKVNQILPIMQEHFGNSMNLARIRKLRALKLHALCVVQTVDLHKLASAMPTAVERDSNLRSIQQFIAHCAFSLDIVARMAQPQRNTILHPNTTELPAHKAVHWRESQRMVAVQLSQGRAGEMLL